MPTESIKTWPTAQDIEAVFEALEPGLVALDEIAGPPCCGYLGLVIDADDDLREDGFSLRPGVPVPTYQDIGVMAIFIDRLRGQAEELAEVIKSLEEAFHLARLNGTAEDDRSEVGEA